MAREILGGFGPDSSQPQKPRASNGGKMPVRDVMNYATPSIPGWDPHGSKRPGIGGHNCGNAGTQGRQAEGHSESAEARYYTGNRAMANEETDAEEMREHYGSYPRLSGGPGLGGRNKGSGTNRG